MPARAAEIEQTLLATMQEQRPQEDPDLTLQQLADQLEGGASLALRDPEGVMLAALMFALRQIVSRALSGSDVTATTPAVRPTMPPTWLLSAYASAPRGRARVPRRRCWWR